MEERTQQEARLSQNLHQQSQKEYDKQQNALCFVVIGSIIFVVGILFIFISMKREYGEIVGLDVTSLAFYLMIIALVLGAASIIYGLTKFILSYKRRKEIIRKINTLK